MSVDLWVWAAFAVLVLICLAVDLGLSHRSREHSMRGALIMTAFWIVLAILFGVFIYFYMGSEDAVEYYTGYAVEKAMSLDTLFVFMFVFSYFAIPTEYRHRVLFYGIIGALAFRALFIFLGVEIIMEFTFLMPLLGVFLVYTAVKTATRKENERPDLNRNPMVRVFKRLHPTTTDLDGDRFFTLKDGVKTATPLFLALIAIESTDILFSIDSIPAVLAITQNTFIVYTSNVFAMLGLRSLYSVLEGSLQSFRYLKYGLGAILMFVGVKILAHGYLEIPTLLSLAFIISAMAVSVLASRMADSREARAA